MIMYLALYEGEVENIYFRQMNHVQNRFQTVPCHTPAKYWLVTKNCYMY